MNEEKNEDITIDCVQMKRNIQREISEEMKNLSPEEKLKYYKKLADESPFAGRLKRRKTG